MTPSFNNSDLTGAQQISVQRYRWHTEDSFETLNIEDSVAVESPLEIRIVFGPKSKRKDRSLSITMRTPGDDDNLAAGFLLSEGIISSGQEVEDFEYCGVIPEGESISNQLRVNLTPEVVVDMSQLQRHFYTTSSCGVCGKASLEAIESQNVLPIEHDHLTVSPDTIRNLPVTLGQRQRIFDNTGGLHAAGLFDASGALIDLREDVGRHNAVDKLVGKQINDVRTAASMKQSMTDSVLVVSGRASFELVQKAVVSREMLPIKFVGLISKWPGSFSCDCWCTNLLNFVSEAGAWTSEPNWQVMKKP